MDGLNLKNCRDTFGFIDNIISIGMEIKKVFTRPKLTVNINNKVFNIIGRLGTYHSIVDITKGDNLNIGDEVILDISPMYANINIRREYIK